MPDLPEIFARLYSHTPAGVFSTLGLLLLALALSLAFRALRLAGGETTGGAIIEWKKRKSKRHVHFIPIVRFHAGAAGEFEVQSQTVFRDQPGLANEPVSVRFDPRNPKRADIEGMYHPWRPVIALIVLGVGTLAVGWQAGDMPEGDGSDIASTLIVP